MRSPLSPSPTREIKTMAGNYKLIGTDQSITLYLGGQFDGSLDASLNPNFPAPGGGGKSLLGIAKHIGIKGSVETTNVKGIGQPTKANRYHSEGGTLDLDMFVTTTGFDLSLAALGDYVIIVHKPLSSMANGYGYAGVLTEWDYDGTEGSEQSIKCTIDLTPDFLPVGD